MSPGEKNDKNEKSVFLPRLRDLCRAAENGRPAATHFLTPEENAEAVKCLKYEYPGLPFEVFGGYPDAERCLILLGDERYYRDKDKYIRAVKADTSGYGALSHRAVLGSVLSCGIVRESVGDIVLPDGEGSKEAVIFCSPVAAEAICGGPEALCRIGRDPVKVSFCSPDEVSGIRKVFLPVEVTVASDRLDCVAAALSGLSRDDVREYLRRGDIMLDHARTEKPDADVAEGSVISIRGKGKFRIDSYDGTTRKGRLRLKASKYG